MGLVLREHHRRLRSAVTCTYCGERVPAGEWSVLITSVPRGQVRIRRCTTCYLRLATVGNAVLEANNG